MGSVMNMSREWALYLISIARPDCIIPNGEYAFE